MATQSLRIVLSGMVAGDPHQGGATWAVLQYLIGLRGMGHTVCLVEPMERKQVRPEGGALADSVNARYFGAVMRRYPHAEPAAVLLAGTRETAGSSYAALREFASTADVLINVSGLLTDAALLESIPVRVYLDLDPAFNQLWHAVEGIDRHLSGHTHFATVADAIGRQDCMVPDCGVSWIPTLPPVVLSEWPVSSSVTRDALTTVGNWPCYPHLVGADVADHDVFRPHDPAQVADNALRLHGKTLIRLKDVELFLDGFAERRDRGRLPRGRFGGNGRQRSRDAADDTDLEDVVLVDLGR